MKPEINEVWMNIHDGEKVVILQRIFFNIHIKRVWEGALQTRYIHYKTFQKNWMPFGELSIVPCPKCNRPFLNYSILGMKREEPEILMVCHKAKKKKDPYLGTEYTVYSDRCFLTFDESQKIVDLVECEKCKVISIKDKWRCACHLTDEERQAQDQYWQNAIKEDFVNDYEESVQDEDIDEAFPPPCMLCGEFDCECGCDEE